MEELIWKHVVLNAKKYGKPNEKAVIGKILAESPELRKNAKEVLERIKAVIHEFENLDDARKKELYALYSEEKSGEKQDQGLPPLKNAEKGKVVMRFAPNPNGPPTIGSARGIVVNDEYAKMYGGRLILRFDDTDPRTKRPMIEAYDWYLEDAEWLGAKVHQVVYASRRIDLYYDYAVKLIEMGHAYVCRCARDEFKRYKDAGLPCPHRERSVEENLEDWERMLDGTYGEGEAVLRIKTDMAHKDPAVRDWVAFRIIDSDHPLVGARYRVYPTLDFESAVEDHELGVTHILRGKDLADSEKRQRYIYEYFGWEYPVVRLWGRVKIHEFGKFSTSTLRKDIESGKYSGWDDPALPTVRALRRRGFRAEAIRNFLLSLGVGENDVSVSLKNLYAENRKIVDGEAKRFFFVWKPVKLEMDGLDGEVEVNLPVHPSRDMGVRTLRVSRVIYITEDDYRNFSGKEVRLKGFCNIRIENRKAVYLGDDIESAKKGRNIIHWLPEGQVIGGEVITPEGTVQGLFESNAVDAEGEVVQFERYAFCRIERAGERITAVYTHP
ncbi:glutamate--tRNA ligase [Geoglobus acetivorans]|uniref:Glutamate--tRNA ligase n=1 Tax=Geoglobus acetivorans TaxID=565033 RepID=A0A0A7GHF8_GEOAI|nr:Glutamyl-tRNA synthetase [Geoglobus acetivorans]